jgi:hypothetical protein
MLFGLLAATSALAGCDGMGPQCTCSIAGALIPQPEVSSPVVGLSADPPCSALLEPAPDGGVQIFVGVTGEVLTSTGSCQIRETLADGTVLTAELMFERIPATGCCRSPTRNVGPAPVLTSQGSDGGG